MAAPDEAPISVGFVGSLGRACFSDLWLNACPGRDISYRTGTRRALLAAVAASELDIAIYPGAREADVRTLLLCEDRLVVALGVRHPLSALSVIGLAALCDYPLLLPEGEESDFRRLAQTLVPGLSAIGEVPMAVLLHRLTTSDALALVADSQRDELRGDIVMRPVDGPDTCFPIHLAWAAAADALGLGELLSARISPPAPACAMERAGSGQDDAGGGTDNGAGDTVLG